MAAPLFVVSLKVADRLDQDKPVIRRSSEPITPVSRRVAPYDYATPKIRFTVIDEDPVETPTSTGHFDESALETPTSCAKSAFSSDSESYRSVEPWEATFDNLEQQPELVKALHALLKYDHDIYVHVTRPLDAKKPEKEDEPPKEGTKDPEDQEEPNKDQEEPKETTLDDLFHILYDPETKWTAPWHLEEAPREMKRQFLLLFWDVLDADDKADEEGLHPEIRARLEDKAYRSFSAELLAREWQHRHA